MRKTDNNRNTKHFRSADRLFRVDDQWYVETREGDIGPFPTRQDATMRLRQHVGEQESLQHAKEQFAKVRGEKTYVDTAIWDQQIAMD